MRAGEQTPNGDCCRENTDHIREVQEKYKQLEIKNLRAQQVCKKQQGIAGRGGNRGALNWLASSKTFDDFLTLYNDEEYQFNIESSQSWCYNPILASGPGSKFLCRSRRRLPNRSM
jgi:hypothetical protein